MAISGPGWSSDLAGRFAARGYNGKSLQDFADAVGNGSVASVVGKSFSTVDVGIISGSGIGTGTGITGLDAASVSSAIFNQAVAAFGRAGDELQEICDDIADSLVAQMALVTLSSTHSPVYTGTGTVAVGSIGVIGSGWGDAIENEGLADSFTGEFWNDFAEAIGDGCASEVIGSGTGTVTIVGTGSPGNPGGGTGSGTIS